MKPKIIVISLFAALSLSACSLLPFPTSHTGNRSEDNTSSGPTTSGDITTTSNNPGTSGDTTTTSQGDDPITPTGRRMQDTPMLHCFNWSMKNIENSLSEIKDAGFKTIQLSPMQPQKDPYDGDWSSQWWKLYQPFGFSVSTSTSQNKLGGKSDLKSLCQKAKAQGIDVIVDIVSNHLAGKGKSTFADSVKSFESDIYNQNLQHNVDSYVNDNNVQYLLQGHLGDYPDLKTESTVVQNRVLSLLKEYLDCGVNGFRFDAAKHIETPKDGTYKSDFWPTILNGATNYASSKGYDNPYYYGEILNPVGSGRNVSYYTDYMSITDNNHSSKVLWGVVNKNLNNLNPSYYDVPSKSVLWAESHDTYSNDGKETTNVSEANINKAYAIETSRKDVSTLYLSRPQGNLGSKGKTEYKTTLVKAINNFHNLCVGLDESITTSNGYFINQRSSLGAVVININGNSLSSISLDKLEDGNYINLMNNQAVKVQNHTANVSFIDDAIILVNEKIKDGPTTNLPKITLGSYKEVYSGSQTITVNASDATSVTYSINNGTKQTLSGGSVTLPTTLSNGLVTLVVTAENNAGTTTKTIKLIKTTTLVDKSLIIYDLDSNYAHYLWVWKDSGEGSWKDATLEGNVLGYSMGSNNYFIIGKFQKGTSISNASWDTVIEKSEDVSFNKTIYDYKEFTFSPKS